MTQILLEDLLQKNPRALGKAMTLMESNRENDQRAAENLLIQLLKVHKNKGPALRIGISGIPGVGKSTFIDALGMALLKSQQKSCIAVITVDPSSPLVGGSLMGDKFRMEALVQHERAYIRPSPDRSFGGGITRSMAKSIELLEYCGFSHIFIETVGVGQSEYRIASMVDGLLLLMMPSTGDDVQSLKRGILELADGIIIHKADGDLKRKARELKSNLSIGFVAQKKTPLILCSSRDHSGIDSVLTLLEKLKLSAGFDAKRTAQRVLWFEEELELRLLQKWKRSKEFLRAKETISFKAGLPFEAAEKLAQTLFFCK
jgi:LAO/AO transport system kinase